MALEAGSKLGHYEIVSSLGVGGMGEVYRAKDTKLGREVAVKLLLEEVSSDPERLARFEREARVLASLNHANIATMHGFEAEGDTHFLVMELVEGETLAERIERSAILVEEAIPLFIQIAEGLEAAHERGVIHRDLKPANIKVSSEGNAAPGRVKILDFGLAKALALEADGVGDLSASLSPTLTLAATQRGEILGTAAYMSPEQARGQVLDKRTDIWAFGVCLWEALTGKRLFQGEDAVQIMARVVEQRPDLGSSSAISPKMQNLVERCLEKAPHDRLRDIGDARLELVAIAAADPDAALADHRGGRLGKAAALAAIALLVGVLAGREIGRRSADPIGPAAGVARVQVALPEGVRVHARVHVPLALSADGRMLAAVGWQGGLSQLYVRELEGAQWRPLAGTEDAVQPTFSPDGDWVAFFAAGELRKTPLAGGPTVAIAAAGNPAGASWGSDGSILFVPEISSGLMRVAAEGGEVRQLTQPDANAAEWHQFPHHLPDGEHAVFVRRPVGSGSELRLLSLETGEHRVFRSGSAAYWLDSGHLLFSSVREGGLESALQATRLQLESLELAASAVPVLDGVAAIIGLQRHSLAASATGHILFAAKKTPELVVVARDGTATLTTEPQGLDQVLPRLSPDGHRVAVLEGMNRIWVIDLERGSRTLVVGGNPEDPAVWGPIWSPDGQYLAFGYVAQADFDIARLSIDSGMDVEIVSAIDGAQFPSSWSIGGAIAYHAMVEETGFDVWVLPPDGDPVPIARTPAWEGGAIFSPDGKLLAYTSNQSGRFEVYVQSYPPTGAAIAVSIGGGREPMWSPDGRELYYRSGEEMLAVTVDAGQPLHLSEPRLVFRGHYDATPWPHLSNYDVTPDGRFLMLSDTSVDHLELILNFDEELTRRVLGD